MGDNKPLLFGIGMVAVGGLVGLATLTNGGSGESYIVTAVLIVVGGISLARGVYLHSKAKSNSSIRLRKLQ